MGEEANGGDLHIGRNIDSLQRQLGVSDEDMLAELGLSYNRFWDMKRREWAQKRTVAQVAAALSRLSGVAVQPDQVMTGRLRPEDFGRRAVAEFLRRAQELDPADGLPNGDGVRLPRLHLGSLPAGPAETFQAAGSDLVVRADPGDFVVTADGDCMLPTLGHGDELVCVFTEQADDGQLAVVSYADEGGLWQSGVKRVRRDGDRLWLSCDNLGADSLGQRRYPDIHPAELRIHGIVVGLWRALR